MTDAARRRERPRPRRADAERNAGLLVAAAREVFAERGPEAALDDVARRAGVGNATLYRHFPTRGDLLVAVYADEVAGLCGLAAALLRDPAPAEALFAWLEEFAAHVATKRELALAITDDPAGKRTALFERWHGSMRSAAAGLLERAQDAGAVRPEPTAADLLALAGAAALAGSGPAHVRRLLAIVRHGAAVPEPA
jgi:AcrR family transcriptional regulator